MKRSTKKTVQRTPHGSRLRLKKGKDSEGVLLMHPVGSKASFRRAALAATGTNEPEIAEKLIGQIMNLAESDSIDEINASLIAVQALKPRDTYEGILIAQMIGTHNLAMLFMAKAIKGRDTNEIEMNVNRANKFLRTFTAQFSTLNQYRTQGYQGNLQGPALI